MPNMAADTLMKQLPEYGEERALLDKQAASVEKTAGALFAVVLLQTVVAIGLALCLLLVGTVAAYSSICGSLTVYIPGMAFTLLVARKIGGSSTVFLGVAAMAEFGKLFLTGLLCALVFIYIRPLEPVWFFAGMLSVLATGWVGLAKAIR